MWNVLRNVGAFFRLVNNDTVVTNYEEEENKYLSVLNAVETVGDETEGVEQSNDTVSNLCCHRVGHITHFTNDGNSGMIDSLYIFDLKDAPSEIKIGDRVSYIAYRPNENSIWIVKQIYAIQNDMWDDKSGVGDDTTNGDSFEQQTEVKSSVQERNAVGKVVKRIGRELTIQPGNHSVHLDKISTTFVPVEGDWVLLTSIVEVDKDAIDHCGIVLQIESMSPLRSRIIQEGTVSHWEPTFKCGIIDSEAQFSLDACEHGYIPVVGDAVVADVIESEQGALVWRALTVIPLLKTIRKKQNVNNDDIDNSRGQRMTEVMAFSKNESSSLKFLLQNKCGISISENCSFGEVEMGTETELVVHVNNDSNKSYQLISATFKNRHSSHVKLISPKLYERSRSKPFYVDPSSSVKFVFKITPRFVGKCNELFVWKFKDFEIGRNIVYNIIDNYISSIKNSKIKKFRASEHKITAQQIFATKNGFLIAAERAFRPAQFVPIKLGFYPVPTRLWEAVLGVDDLKRNRETINNSIIDCMPSLHDSLSLDNYRNRWHAMLFLEEIDIVSNMRHYDMPRTHFVRQGDFLVLNVPGLAEKRPSLICGDTIVASDPCAADDKIVKYEGAIHKICQNDVWLKFNKKFHDIYNGEDYTVVFNINRTGFKRCHQAVDVAWKNLSKGWLFPSSLRQSEFQIVIEEDDLDVLTKVNNSSQDNSVNDNHGKIVSVKMEDGLTEMHFKSDSEGNGNNVAVSNVNEDNITITGVTNDIHEDSEGNGNNDPLSNMDKDNIMVTGITNDIHEDSEGNGNNDHLSNMDKDNITVTSIANDIHEDSEGNGNNDPFSKLDKDNITFTGVTINEESKTLPSNTSPMFECRSNNTRLSVIDRLKISFENKSNIVKTSGVNIKNISRFCTTVNSSSVPLNINNSQIDEKDIDDNSLRKEENVNLSESCPIAQGNNVKNIKDSSFENDMKQEDLEVIDKPLCDDRNLNSTVSSNSIPSNVNNSQIGKMNIDDNSSYKEENVQLNESCPIAQENNVQNVKDSSFENDVKVIDKSFCDDKNLNSTDTNVNDVEVDDVLRKINLIYKNDADKSQMIKTNFSWPQDRRTNVNVVSECHTRAVPKAQKSRKLKWFNSKLNLYQKEAVKNILRGEARPLPYIIFGPPGTGKTITLVETALQLLNLMPDSRILIGTPSNSAANLICERLLDSGLVLPGMLIRLCSHSYFNEEYNSNISDRLRPYCTTAEIKVVEEKLRNTVPNKRSTQGMQREILGRHRVTVGTCVTLGILYNIGFPQGHFTHIMVDEAGQATEPETLIPLAFLDDKYGQSILAGDPMQLGPVVQSRYAINFGMRESFLMRLLTRFPYTRDVISFPDTCGYDPRVVTRLVNNYRSVPQLLKLPSQMFYENTLIPEVDEVNSIEAKILQNIKAALLHLSDIEDPDCTITSMRPAAILFHGVRGVNYQENDSPSWFNPEEVVQTVFYATAFYRAGLTVDQIGIISPYQKQVSKIRSLFNKLEIPLPKVGSVEEFQGQERMAILLSTVRSSCKLKTYDAQHALGFVSSPQRLNVALTRARAIIVVIGDPHLLNCDPYWRTVLKYCIDTKGYHGCDLPIDLHL